MHQIKQEIGTFYSVPSVCDLNTVIGMKKAFGNMSRMFEEKDSNSLIKYLERLAMVDFNKELVACTEMIGLLKKIEKSNDFKDNVKLIQFAYRVGGMMAKYVSVEDQNKEKKTSGNERESRKIRNKPIAYQAKPRKTGLHGENDDDEVQLKGEPSGLTNWSCRKSYVTNPISNSLEINQGFPKRPIIRKRKNTERGPKIIEPQPPSEPKKRGRSRNVSELPVDLLDSDFDNHSMISEGKSSEHSSASTFASLECEQNYYHTTLNRKTKNVSTNRDSTSVSDFIKPIDYGVIEIVYLSYKEKNPEMYNIVVQEKKSKKVSKPTESEEYNLAEYLKSIDEVRKNSVQVIPDKHFPNILRDATVKAEKMYQKPIVYQFKCIKTKPQEKNIPTKHKSFLTLNDICFSDMTEISRLVGMYTGMK
uniref:SPK domain-containing protein n=1 Tax=Parastrongyloides trichosuri TaxID=131310 RepID=A0A0N4ZFD8_PARTI